MLTMFGLELMEEAVYREIGASPPPVAEEIADRLAVAPDLVRACIDRLLELGLVRGSFEVPGRFAVVDPILSLQQSLAGQYEELTRRQRRVAETHAEVVRLLMSDASGRPGRVEQVERLLGMDEVQCRVDRLAGEAIREVLTFVPGGARSTPELSAARRNDEALLSRSVSIRTVGTGTDSYDAATMAHVHWLTGNGGQFRGFDAPLPGMILFDGSVALVPLDPQNTAAGALQVTDPGLVAPMVVLFEQTWSLATPLDAGRSTTDDTLNGKERALLRLVAEGCTDAAAAGQLHVSHRTARRMMAVLMERLGARSRFEAGVKAARLGWL
ncbi:MULTISPECIES: helix-turn-helix transcriptional regulator [unclassified Streptomyces]|uniref:helix-turn-helix domain-containing protein n=1 Tax=unclassified Streptomyces TaxID=2593676 RepID=UPI00093F5094|nr:helix-turn-helix transcriptional regulator [Streptomyces sp. TSRI0281]OKI44775.1 helix-turn-helix transcriptional regulator [Streptomyces sp. TSRI0281]